MEDESPTSKTYVEYAKKGYVIGSPGRITSLELCKELLPHPNVYRGLGCDSSQYACWIFIEIDDDWWRFTSQIFRMNLNSEFTSIDYVTTTRFDRDQTFDVFQKIAIVEGYPNPTILWPEGWTGPYRFDGWQFHSQFSEGAFLDIKISNPPADGGGGSYYNMYGEGTQNDFCHMLVYRKQGPFSCETVTISHPTVLEAASVAYTTASIIASVLIPVTAFIAVKMEERKVTHQPDA